ncbi:MAG: hypothetical protein AAF593_14660 [Planctomycetota bacterium]
MSYSHTFYAIDLERLRGLWGSDDQGFAGAFAEAMAEEIEDNDLFFEDAIDEDRCPDTKAALLHILAGDIPKPRGHEAMYGYTLGMLFDHLGTLIECNDVYRVQSHPFASLLLRSGPPLPIPVDKGDFPEIGFVAKSDLDREINALDAAPRRAPRSIWSKLTGGLVGGDMAEDELAEDMAAYREALAFCRERGQSLVSIRH